jgi:hypothetical protein
MEDALADEELTRELSGYYTTDGLRLEMSYSLVKGHWAYRKITLQLARHERLSTS